MGLKRKNKVSAEFSMSSLTDIIFLLLIFFMLTSSLVSPNALNFKMPGSSKSKTPPSKEKLTDVVISSSGIFKIDGRKSSESRLKKKLQGLRGKTITISPSPDAPIEKVATVMDLALRYKITTILTAERE